MFLNWKERCSRYKWCIIGCALFNRVIYLRRTYRVFWVYLCPSTVRSRFIIFYIIQWHFIAPDGAIKRCTSSRAQATCDAILFSLSLSVSLLPSNRIVWVDARQILPHTPFDTTAKCCTELRAPSTGTVNCASTVMFCVNRNKKNDTK